MNPAQFDLRHCLPLLLLVLGACQTLPMPDAPSIHPAAQERRVAPARSVASAWIDPALLDTPDLWGRMRRGFALAPLEGELTEAHARRFARDAFLQRRAELIRIHLPMIVGELEERHMPLELALLPLVESALNPQALSPVGAAGTWQFMAPTARRFALRTSRLVDDRRNVQRSTAAALDYLQTLYAQFGDWHLAMAAYNWGEGRVQSACERLRRQGIRPDFNAMSALMPPETRNYVPQIIALGRLVGNPGPYGAVLPDVAAISGLVTVRLERDMDLALALQFSGLSQSRFLALNPAARPPLLLATATPGLRLPPEAAERFDLARDAHVGRLASWSVYRVTQTETLDTIARREGVALDDVRAANGIPPGMKPLAGSVLLLPVAARDGAAADHATVAGASLALVRIERQAVPKIRAAVAPATLLAEAPAAHRLSRCRKKCIGYVPGVGLQIS